MSHSTNPPPYERFDNPPNTPSPAQKSPAGLTDGTTQAQAGHYSVQGMFTTPQGMTPHPPDTQQLELGPTTRPPEPVVFVQQTRRDSSPLVLAIIAVLLNPFFGIPAIAMAMAGHEDYQNHRNDEGRRKVRLSYWLSSAGIVSTGLLAIVIVFSIPFTRELIILYFRSLAR